MAYKSIIAMVKPNLTDTVVDSAKKVGATGISGLESRQAGRKTG